MAAGDGLIVRIFAGSRAFSASEARAVAALAEAHGSGQIELTRRANLQLRGVSEAALPALQRALFAQGLAFESPAEERRMALLVSPLSEVDARARPLVALAEALMSALRGAHELSALPSKFGLVLDGDGDLLASVAADVRLALHSHAPDLLHLSVAGDHGDVWLGACAPERGPEAVLVLAGALCTAGGLRMREWLAQHGSEAARALVQPWLLAQAHAPRPLPRPLRLGFQAGEPGGLALGLPFGVAQVAQWRALVELAESAGDGRVRITPARAVILPGLKESSRDRVRALIREHGFLSDDRDPLRRVVACTGAPSCSSAWAETRHFARKIALAAEPLLSLGSTLHVSGCEKSCARSGAAELTVVHTREGLKLGFQQSVQEVANSKAIDLPELLARLTEHSHEPEVLLRAEGTRPTLDAHQRGPLS
jgi:precorrin-3B synthase